MYSSYSHESTSHHNHKAQQNTKCTNSLSTPTRKRSEIPWRNEGKNRKSVGTTCTINDRQFVICKNNATSQTVNKPCIFRKNLIRPNSCSFRAETWIEWVRNIRRTTYSHDGNHNNNSKQNNSSTKRRTATNKWPILKENRTCQYRMGKNAFVKSRSDKMKSKLPKDQMQKHTHPVYTAKELTI